MKPAEGDIFFLYDPATDQHCYLSMIYLSPLILRWLWSVRVIFLVRS